jgi:hypothetical protein
MARLDVYESGDMLLALALMAAIYFPGAWYCAKRKGCNPWIWMGGGLIWLFGGLLWLFGGLIWLFSGLFWIFSTMLPLIWLAFVPLLRKASPNAATKNWPAIGNRVAIVIFSIEALLCLVDGLGPILLNR